MHGIRAALCGALCISTFAEAQGLDERTAVERTLARAEYAELQEGRIEAAQGEVRQAATLPNPQLAFAREPGESSLQVSQRFDISGRRSLARDAAEQRLGATRLEQADLRRGLVAQARRTFAEALAQERAAAARLEWVRTLDAATAIVERLVRGGEQSGYALRRQQRELQAARARSAAGDADRVRAREALVAITGVQAARTEPLVGDLLPGAAGGLQPMLERLPERPDIAALATRAGAFERDAQAAERQRIPDLTAGVGAKRVDDPSRADSGVMLMLAIPLPLFERGQGTGQAARGNARAVRAEYTLALARAQSELRGSWQQAAALRDAAEVLRADTARASELSRIAEQAYRAGESSILELLDAYRSSLEAETSALELELRARLARIELDTLTGNMNQ